MRVVHDGDRTFPARLSDVRRDRDGILLGDWDHFARGGGIFHRALAVDPAGGVAADAGDGAVHMVGWGWDCG